MANDKTKRIRRRAELICAYRTVVDPGSFEHEIAEVKRLAAIGHYDPWYCVACGHPHHDMTRHHRVPRRVFWKIPEEVWMEYLKGDERVVPMCKPCHRFIESKRRGPCPQKLNPEYAKLSWAQLIEEIDLFERIAYERTEELIKLMRSQP